MAFKELIKYEAVGLSLTEKIQLMEVDLLENGFSLVSMKGSNKNLNYAYLSEDSDYAVIIIEPVCTNGRKYFCILTKEVYELNKELVFSVESNRHIISDDISDTSEYRIMVYRSGIVDVHTSIWERIVEKGDLPDIDHQYHSHSINLEEFLRPCTRQQNKANTKGTKSDDPIFKYKSEEDFSFTWYAFVYWKLFEKMTKEEAFAYNLKMNEQVKMDN